MVIVLISCMVPPQAAFIIRTFIQHFTSQVIRKRMLRLMMRKRTEQVRVILIRASSITIVIRTLTSPFIPFQLICQDMLRPMLRMGSSIARAPRSAT